MLWRTFWSWLSKNPSSRSMRRPYLGCRELEQLEDRTVLDSTFYKLFTTQHIDLALDYVNGQWDLSSEIGSDNPNDPATDYSPSHALHYVHPGARVNRPAGSQWDFLGVASGQPLYVLPQSQNSSLLYLGVAAEETAPGTFAEYNETDPRVTNVLALPWITARVTGVRGPGHFSMWQTSSFGTPTVFVSTAQNGLEASDKFFMIEGGHAHYNFGFSAPGFYEIDVQASAFLGPNQTNPTTSPIATYYFTVDDLLKVTSITPTETGFIARFNRPVDLSTLNLYDTATGLLGPSDVNLVGSSTGAVRGSLVVPSAAIPNESSGNLERVDALNTVEFIRTGGPLAADTYTITLRSDNTTYANSKGFRTTATPNATSILDGNGDGTTGDNFTSTFTVTSGSNRVVSVADFTRGYGQTVNVPASGSGLPITVDNADAIRRVEFILEFNPDLLNITAASRGPTIPDTFSVTFQTLSAGRVRVILDGPTALPSGSLTLLNLTANVPNNAPYADKHVLRLTNLSINSGAVSAKPDHGVHVAAYFGDTTGNRTYSGLDASNTARTTNNLDTGYLAYQNADPILIADISGNGTFQAVDAQRIAEKVVGLTVGEIPNLPSGVNPPPAGGPDPRLFIPTDLVGDRGSTITVPVRIEVTESGGVAVLSADYGIGFDPNLFTVSNVRTTGTLLNGFSLSTNIDNTAGTIRVSTYSSTAVSMAFGTIGDILLVDFTVKANAAFGATQINLMQNVQSTITALNEGQLTISPAITNNPNDTNVDGTFTIAVVPRVQDIVINNGAAQRSKVTTIRVTFNTTVDTTLLATAFTLTRVGDNATIGTINVSTTTVDGRTVATLTFAGTNVEFGSLADGNWTLTIDRTKVRSTTSNILMLANFNQTDIKRLFGDGDGDGDVDSDDFLNFANAFGQTNGDAGYLAYLDFDNDGDIDSDDFLNFANRYGSSI